ncbi:LuxR C-terminal-related transcriptional regulator [Ornithinimicrobium avium]|uniref:DNA-binding response regulator n=1 Tax=Ornithinimicrobium avium TaxID=2283195 RepID=A0A345NJX3_9MICO|nr:LuxR C-terminal-related transcriptional regulator [Ornithinimicrobium avium]AXH95331.1 DNA-binding response regulator [Ornithinimicrobium avium]
MNTVTVRGMDEKVHRRLQQQAAANRRSVEAEARAILTAALTSVARAVAACPGPLTAGEDRVAGLVAQGWSNRQIADQLHLSERTVEAHVSAILRKLCLRSRAGVASWVTARTPAQDGATGTSVPT